MVLWAGIALGLMVGLGLAAWNRVRYEAPKFHHLWLVPVAFLVQRLEQSKDYPIIMSQIMFLAFIYLNRVLPGMNSLLIGAALNFAVMAANSGRMPISPETASRLFPQENLWDYPAGTLIGAKDILLPPEQTRFEWLADRFLPPNWLPYQFAFSLGDVFIAAGAFWLLAKPTSFAKGKQIS